MGICSFPENEAKHGKQSQGKFRFRKYSSKVKVVITQQ